MKLPGGRHVVEICLRESVQVSRLCHASARHQPGCSAHLDALHVHSPRQRGYAASCSCSIVLGERHAVATCGFGMDNNACRQSGLAAICAWKNLGYQQPGIGTSWASSVLTVTVNPLTCSERMMYPGSFPLAATMSLLIRPSLRSALLVPLVAEISRNTLRRDGPSKPGRQ